MDPNTQPQPAISPELSRTNPAETAVSQNEHAPLPTTEVTQGPPQNGSASSVTSTGNQLPDDALVGSASMPTSSASNSNVVLSPEIADDVDVIEKEWVDAAEKIIETTKNDPFQEEEAEEKLQIDYLKKRYGIDVKKS